MRKTLATAVLTVAGLGVGIAPAHADFAGTNCPGAPYACFWKDTGYQTVGNQNNYFKFQMYFKDGRDFYFANTGYQVDNRTSSGVNDATSRDIWMYNGLNCAGSETVHRGPEWADSDFSNDTPLGNGAFNDSISSAAFDNYLTSCHG